MEEKIRVRYAPSPTGMLHIGGARSALFNYLFAKKNNGTFVFRVEDTDVERNIAGGEESQLNDLIWLGIVPDESPQNPNPMYAPYRQMERLDTYRYWANWLVEHGYAYECYCNEEELEESRNLQLENGISAPTYDRHCLHLSEEDKERYRKEGRTPCIRIRMKDHHQLAFNDLVRGPVNFSTDDIGDWVIMKSNGIPTYNFAVVIDDHMMNITHVLRGEEHLSNTPKQLQVYEYLGWKPPVFGHMTIIINENGKKLSKRDNNILQFMSQYRSLGYLKEAIVNFILLLGWTPEDNREFFTLDEAVKAFNATKLSRSPSMFDQQKLNWINGQYIKKMGIEEYLSFIKPFVLKAIEMDDISNSELEKIAMPFKEQILFGEEIVKLIKDVIDFTDLVDEEAMSYLKLPTTPLVIESLKSRLSKLEEITPITLKSIFKEIGIEVGVKGKELYMPIRIKLTHQMHGIELYNVINILGKEESIRRLSL